MTYDGRRKRSRRIRQDYVHRDLWLRYPRYDRREGTGPLQCTRLVDEVRISPGGAYKVKVRCTNDAVRRMPGHGAPVCSGPCKQAWLYFKFAPILTVNHDPGDEDRR